MIIMAVGPKQQAALIGNSGTHEGWKCTKLLISDVLNILQTNKDGTLRTSLAK